MPSQSTSTSPPYSPLVFSHSRDSQASQVPSLIDYPSSDSSDSLPTIEDEQFDDDCGADDNASIIGHFSPASRPTSHLWDAGMPRDALSFAAAGEATMGLDQQIELALNKSAKKASDGRSLRSIRTAVTTLRGRNGGRKHRNTNDFFTDASAPPLPTTTRRGSDTITVASRAATITPMAISGSKTGPVGEVKKEATRVRRLSNALSRTLSGLKKKGGKGIEGGKGKGGADVEVEGERVFDIAYMGGHPLRRSVSFTGVGYYVPDRRSSDEALGYDEADEILGEAHGVAHRLAEHQLARAF
ncbi:hypothetical protein BDV98DRAFT_591789 [Pterulicium gracile]|uniref:Uncharacterized protein n=1 Tax=Pterulicium gracile TaxID=1884261 RepID=A0A5C3QR28_9AGAR|nr:hypothetical protein BDV98DRAFT_591789 [Pterula gracilis]